MRAAQCYRVARSQMITKIAVFSCYFALSFMPHSVLAEEDTDYRITSIATDLGVAWGMVFLTPETMLITEREGYLLKLDLHTGNISDIAGVTWDIVTLGQGGLLDVAIADDYQQTGWIYFSYSKPVEGQSVTALARAKLLEDELVEWQDLFISQSRSPTSIHFAGRIAFDNQGHVFLSIGDRGVRDNAQDRTNHAGTIVRLNMNGNIPEDNPFIQDDKALDEIWSYGHRNPQGLFFNNKTQQLWSIEHGPRGGDEINLIEKGKNYGWPTISYGKEYLSFAAVGEGTHKEGMEQPIKVYVPSIAPSSLIQYQGELFEGWQGNLVSGALKLQHLNRIQLDENNNVVAEHRLLSSLKERIRNIIESPDGVLYLSTDSGSILKMTPSSE